MVAADWSDRLAQAGLGDFQTLLEDALPTPHLAGRWQLLTKPGLAGRQRWRWELDDQPAGILYVKRYQGTPLRQQWDRIRRQSLRHSRAWWEFRQSVELARQYIPVVRAIGMVEQVRPPFEFRSAVLFESVAGDALDQVWPKLGEQNAPITHGLARHDLIRRLARLVSAFHQTGTCHRDLYLCHIFADLDPLGRRPPQFTLIDLARTHHPRLRRTRWLIKDLSQLDASARQIGVSCTDRLRFLLAYLGLEAGVPRVRWYARRIVRKSSRILRRIERKSRRS
jgi:hypothetical protein